MNFIVHLYREILQIEYCLLFQEQQQQQEQ